MKTSQKTSKLDSKAALVAAKQERIHITEDTSLNFAKLADSVRVDIAKGATVEIQERHDYGDSVTQKAIAYVLGKGAHVTIRAQESGTMVIARTMTIPEDATLTILAEHTGGASIKDETTAKLSGKNARFVALGSNRLSNKTNSETHLLIHHDVPHTTSKTMYRSVLDDKALGVFEGKIIIAKGADKTEADMTTKAILLSDQARMHGEPQLEIYTDDVICTHGASTGTIDEDALLYLQTRGIARDIAKKELIESFLSEPLQHH